MELLTILFGILSVGALLVSYYFSVKSKLQGTIEDAIVSAEELDEIGAVKMAAAVETVYATVPAALKPFFSKATIENLIQIAFNKIEEYAALQNAPTDDNDLK